MDPLKISDISVAGVDLVIIALYLVGILWAGVYLTKMASRSVDSYFLGGRRIPWWLLGVSGTSCYFDVTGVMWTIAYFYIMGQKFMWIQWEWGFAIMIGFFAAYIGKWLRRSKVVTGGEWMTIRFGSGPAGEAARTAAAILALTIAVAFIGFAEFGCGQFMHMFIPDDVLSRVFPQSLLESVGSAHLLAITLMAVTCIYTIAAGLYGVVLTNVIQFAIILIGSFILIIKAVAMSSRDVIAQQVPAQWFQFRPLYKWDHLQQWEISQGYYILGLLIVVWLAKGFLLGMGGPQQLYDMQRFLSARSPREASQAGMLWGVCLTPMFTLSAAVGVIGMMKWGGQLPHPENLYPVVIGTLLPIGVKGLVLAGLLSAFMSTFASTVNAGASYLVRDLYQNFFRPTASPKEVIRASRISSVIIVVAGIFIGMQAKNIDVIFAWIMMVLGSAVLMPNILRWFWWRFNGAGYAVGTLVGIAASILTAIAFSDVPLYKTFPVLLAISLISSILATILSKPTEMKVLKDFYQRIRPAGFWKPVRNAFQSEGQSLTRESFPLDFMAGIIAAIMFHAIYMISTYLCTKQWGDVLTCCMITLICGILLYFIWYKRLPDKDEDVELAPVKDEF